MIPSTALTLARQSSTSTGMARALLVAMFDMETLLTSNLKGGISKRPGNEDGIRLQKLDVAKLEAIYGEY